MDKMADFIKRVIKQTIKLISISYSMVILVCVLAHHGWIGIQVTITEESFSQLAHYFVLLTAITYILFYIFKPFSANMNGTYITKRDIRDMGSARINTVYSERPFYRLYCDAIHEAAHTVIAEKLGLSVKEVTLQPTEETRGHMELEEPADGFYSLQTVEARIKICMAGILAEYILCQNLNDGGNMKNSDLNQIEELINLYLLHTDDKALLIPSYGYQERIREQAKEMNLKYRKETKELILQHQEEIKNKANELIRNYKEENKHGRN